MEKSREITSNRRESKIRRTKNVILRFIGVAAVVTGLAACTNVQKSDKTASATIRPCTANIPPTPTASDGQVITPPYNNLEKSVNSEAQVVFDRVEANGGSIILDRYTGTSAQISGKELVLNVDDNTATTQGYQVDIAFSGSDPRIGLGTAVCNDATGKVYETNFDQAVDYFYAHTTNFPN